IVALKVGRVWQMKTLARHASRTPGTGTQCRTHAMQSPVFPIRSVIRMPAQAGVVRTTVQDVAVPTNVGRRVAIGSSLSRSGLANRRMPQRVPCFVDTSDVSLSGVSVDEWRPPVRSPLGRADNLGCRAPSDAVAINVEPQSIQATVDWPGLQWSGPSDTADEPAGAFPAGAYVATVTLSLPGLGAVRASLPITVTD